MYGWPGSTLEVSVGGKIVHSFDTAVPVTDMEISTKEAITMLFGSAPEPEPNERRAPTPKAWWRFWDWAEAGESTHGRPKQAPEPSRLLPVLACHRAARLSAGR